jgi:hypothetical protein
VVNLSNSPTFDDASPAFFQTTMTNLLSSAEKADIAQAVADVSAGRHRQDHLPGVARALTSASIAGVSAQKGEQDD